MIDLVVRPQRGDRDAFALLATEISDRLLAVARRILRDVDLAEDATEPHEIVQGATATIDGPR